MALGDSVGNQYLIDPFKVTRSNQGYTGGQQNPSIGAPESDLEVVDKLTSNYYNSWSRLDSFAKTIWKNYGVDVTAPDLSDESQQRLNKIFLKGLAQVKNVGNELKMGRENQKKIFEAASSNPDFITGQQEQGTPTELTGIDAGLTSSTEDMTKSLGKDFTSKKSFNYATRTRDEQILQLSKDLENAKTKEEKIKIQRNIDAVRAATPDFTPNISGEITRKIGNERDQTSKIVDLYSSLRAQAKGGEKGAIEFIRTLPKVLDADFYQGEDGNTFLRMAVKKGESSEVDVDVDLSNITKGSKVLSQTLKELAEGFKYADLEKMESMLLERERKGEMPKPFTEDEKDYINKTINDVVNLPKNEPKEVVANVISDIQDLIVDGETFKVAYKSTEGLNIKEISKIYYDEPFLPGFTGNYTIVMEFTDGTKKTINPNKDSSGKDVLRDLFKRNISKTNSILIDRYTPDPVPEPVPTPGRDPETIGDSIKEEAPTPDDVIAPNDGNSKKNKPFKPFG